MKQHIDSELVIYEVKADIAQFGGEFTVYAVYESEAVSGQPFEYISNLASLADTKHELMTLDQLLEKLLEQDVAD